jgi:hypothetical protein
MTQQQFDQQQQTAGVSKRAKSRARKGALSAAVATLIATVGGLPLFCSGSLSRDITPQFNRIGTYSLRDNHKRHQPAVAYNDDQYYDAMYTDDGITHINDIIHHYAFVAEEAESFSASKTAQEDFDTNAISAGKTAQEALQSGTVDAHQGAGAVKSSLKQSVKQAAKAEKCIQFNCNREIRNNECRHYLCSSAQKYGIRRWQKKKGSKERI